MNALIFLVVLFALAAAAVLVIAISTRLSAPTARPSRREKALEALVEEIRETAYTYRDVDAGLAEAVIDRIKTFHRSHNN